MSKWNAIVQSIEESAKNIKIIPVDKNAVNLVNERYELPEESTLGVVINNCGGIVIDNWIRIYGAGDIDFCTKNDLYGIDGIVVAEDIVGGLFLLLDEGQVGYFAPDTLEVENMEISFSQFLYWCVQGDTDSYYCDFRWSGWKTEAENIAFDEGVSFYPFLWAQAESIDTRSRRIIPMLELVKFELESTL